MFYKFHCLSSVFIISLYLQFSHQTEKSYYTAAVTEYHPINEGTDGVEVANKNAANFITIIQKAATYNADIIVFPEIGLSTIYGNKSVLVSAATLVPDPANAINPCTSKQNFPEYIINLSCAAHEHHMYVVINVREKHSCSGSEEDCPPDGTKLYNTNVVFDRSGTVVARYRKFNLFDSEVVDSTTSNPEMAELSTFRTDFNVTFGMFTCFDILFNSPARDLVCKKNITDIIFPTYWFSELPFLTATQVQSGYSYVHDVNFMGSNINFPKTSSTGSGIYAGVDGFLNVRKSLKPGNTLLVANVPKFSKLGRRYENVDVNSRYYEFNRNEISTVGDDESKMEWLYDVFDYYTTKVYNPQTMNHFNGTICNHGFCCYFDVNSTLQDHEKNGNFYRYRLAVFKGVRYYGTDPCGIEVCSIVACANDTVQSCGKPIDGNVVPHLTFDSIVISRLVDNASAETSFMFPLLFTTDLTPINVDGYSYMITRKNDQNCDEAKLTLTKPHNHLFAFAIYGRDLTQDGKPITISADN